MVSVPETIIDTVSSDSSRNNPVSVAVAVTVTGNGNNNSNGNDRGNYSRNASSVAHLARNAVVAPLAQLFDAVPNVDDLERFNLLDRREAGCGGEQKKAEGETETRGGEGEGGSVDPISGGTFVAGG